MNKKLFLLATSALLLSACGNTEEPPNTGGPDVADTTEQMDTAEQMDTTEVDSSSDTSVDEEADSEDLEEVSDEELDDAEEVDDYAEYEELEDLDVFDPDEYDAHLVTDNQGTRVLLFRTKTDEKQAYKTIFIKHDNRLKVIDLMNDKMVYNEIIN